MLKKQLHIVLLSILPHIAYSQLSTFDTIRLGATIEDGVSYPIVLLPEHTVIGEYMNMDDRTRRNKLRNDLNVVYPYALTAAALLKDINTNMDKIDARRDRKQYLKSVDRQLDKLFKQPLKNMSVDQGHVLIKMINRQSGENCYSIIRELKGGVSAVLWQSVGVFFNNNLRKEYDPTGEDKELEALVLELEASMTYKYHLYVQGELMKKVANH